MARRTCVLLACVAALGLAGAAPADVFRMPAGITSLEWVTVGDAGNEGEVSGYIVGGYGTDRYCGAVDYVYNIGKYEVTAGQYTEFLNAVASTDTYELYNPRMWSEDFGCKIERIGSEDSYTYSVAADRANHPVNYLSWGDAARFANWLHNGQPTGGQNLTTTEYGSYYLNGAMMGTELLSVTREPGATWVIPTEDEWYKAAYYKGGGFYAGYWNFPTQSNAAPTAELTPGTDLANGSANYYIDDYLDTTYYTSEVGSYTAKPSDSAYGTFDQGGNVWEWTESILLTTYRGLRGGGYYYHYDYDLHAAWRYGGFPAYGDGIGFGLRVAQVAGPPLPGDVDIDGFVGQMDLDIVLSEWGNSAPLNYPRADRNADNLVGQYDLDMVLSYWGQGIPQSSVPEPASLSLLALAGLAVMRRRPKRMASSTHAKRSSRNHRAKGPLAVLPMLAVVMLIGVPAVAKITLSAHWNGGPAPPDADPAWTEIDFNHSDRLAPPNPPLKNYLLERSEWWTEPTVTPNGKFGGALDCTFDPATVDETNPNGLATGGFHRLNHPNWGDAVVDVAGTIQFWFKPNWDPATETAQRHLLSNRQYYLPTWNDHTLELVHDGIDSRLYFTNLDGAESYTITYEPGNLTTDWNHIAISWDADGTRLYFNGSLEGSSPVKAVMTPSTVDTEYLFWGGRQSPPATTSQHPADGLYDDVGVYTEALYMGPIYAVPGEIHAPAFSGDLNLDGFVGQYDLDIVLNAWGTSPPSDPRADTNVDNFVGQYDLDEVLQDWGLGTPAVPEPATLSFLTLASLARMRRKRK